MTSTRALVITGVPVENAANRAHARRLDFDITWPAPQLGSVLARCAGCGGAMRIDPESEEVRQDVTAMGYQPALACLTCASLATRAGMATPVHPGDDAMQRFKADLHS